MVQLGTSCSSGQRRRLKRDGIFGDGETDYLVCLFTTSIATFYLTFLFKVSYSVRTTKLRQIVTHLTTNQTYTRTPRRPHPRKESRGPTEGHIFLHPSSHHTARSRRTHSAQRTMGSSPSRTPPSCSPGNPFLPRTGKPGTVASWQCTVVDRKQARNVANTGQKHHRIKSSEIIKILAKTLLSFL